MKKKNTKIGIWGYGRVGKAATEYFYQNGHRVEIMDNRKLSKKELENFKQKNISFRKQEDCDRFFSFNDFLFSSPGIDIRKYYATYINKWLTELDVFDQAFNKPIIAITGSVGKTSVAHLLNEILNKYGLPTIAAGNIGRPTFDVINQQEQYDAAILEVSSFQLEYCKQFSPELAILTNFYPNHLDRHGTIQHYLDAKLHIFAHQQPYQYALLPFKLYTTIQSQMPLQQRLALFSLHQPSAHKLKQLNKGTRVFFMHKRLLVQYHNGSYRTLIDLNQLPPITFKENWLILCSILALLDLPLAPLTNIASDIELPAHRMEYVGTINGVDFYNDSKSTTPASTVAAVKKLSGRPIILFLGGLSKGIDRTPLLKILKPLVKQVFCFGAEANELNYLCKQNTIPSEKFKTLETTLSDCLQTIKFGDQILFSPAGSSFDLFTNYQERGNHFKELVYAYRNKL